MGGVSGRGAAARNDKNAFAGAVGRDARLSPGSFDARLKPERRIGLD